MAQPMLEIKADAASAGQPAQAIPNLLPCRIHHSGPIGPTDAFWEPKEADGKNIAYFRGRKLHGHTVKLPDDYRGVVGMRRESPREEASAKNTAHEIDVIDVDTTPAEQEAQRQRLETGGLDVLAEFDKIVVWGHQSTADAATDPYVRSMDEWVALSEKIHSYE